MVISIKLKKFKQSRINRIYSHLETNILNIFDDNKIRKYKLKQEDVILEKK